MPETVMQIQDIYKKIENHERLSTEQALLLAEEADFLTLAQLADKQAKHINGKRVAYLIDCNINYTNICQTACQFCAFSRPKGHADAWELDFETLDAKIQHAVQQGCRRILLQGGVHPDYNLSYYEKLLRHIKTNHNIQIHAFSPTEIHFLSELENLSYTQVLERLISAGLTSLPGGGAEILVDEIRTRLSPRKCTSTDWLSVMAVAHKLGLKTTATMMMGHIESWSHRVAHLRKLRDLQDQTEGFLSFIAWTFQPAHTKLDPETNKNSKVRLATACEYLRLTAIARLFLDNIKHIQASALTQGEKIAQVALNFGADDIGSVLIEEQVVASAGCQQNILVSRESLIQAIQASGHEPYERDTWYHVLDRAS